MMQFHKVAGVLIYILESHYIVVIQLHYIVVYIVVIVGEINIRQNPKAWIVRMSLYSIQYIFSYYMMVLFWQLPSPN